MKTFPYNSSNGDQLCSNTNITEDSILEDNESFFVVLTTTDSYVKIINGRLEVIIKDNDGKHYSIIL